MLVCLCLWKRGFLLTDLQENSGEFVHRTFLEFEIFMWIFFDCKKCACPFKSHPLNSTFLSDWTSFPFHTFEAWFLHARSPQKLRAWSFRWVSWWFFFTLFSPAVLQRSGAGLFLTLFILLGEDFIVQTAPIDRLHNSECSYWFDWLFMFLYDGAWGLFGLLCMTGRLFTASFCPFKIGCLRPILIAAFFLPRFLFFFNK